MKQIRTPFGPTTVKPTTAPPPKKQPVGPREQQARQMRQERLGETYVRMVLCRRRRTR